MHSNHVKNVNDKKNKYILCRKSIAQCYFDYDYKSTIYIYIYIYIEREREREK